MCELLAISANLPTDACFHLRGLFKRGGNTGPHKDGWGIAFYEGRTCHVFKDTKASVSSSVARFVSETPIHSQMIMGHIRRANRGGISLANTHPFMRELWGRQWTFMHNGQLKGVKKLPLNPQFLPMGTTDSEHAFCWLMAQIVSKFPKPPRQDKTLWDFITEKFKYLGTLGVLNVILSDARYLYAHCSTKLSYCIRQAPFQEVHLVDEDLSLDLNIHHTENAKLVVLATMPLTRNEQWVQLKKGEQVILENGCIVAHFSP